MNPYRRVILYIVFYLFVPGKIENIYQLPIHVYLVTFLILLPVPISKVQPLDHIAPTSHKLQGSSLNKMVVRSWYYGIVNWIYVVLSRVRSLKGLFICQKFDYTKDIAVDSNILKEEERLKLLEDKLVKFLNQNSNDNEINVGNDKENSIQGIH